MDNEHEHAVGRKPMSPGRFALRAACIGLAFFVVSNSVETLIGGAMSNGQRAAIAVLFGLKMAPESTFWTTRTSAGCRLATTELVPILCLSGVPKGTS